MPSLTFHLRQVFVFQIGSDCHAWFNSHLAKVNKLQQTDGAYFFSELSEIHRDGDFSNDFTSLGDLKRYVRISQKLAAVGQGLGGESKSSLPNRPFGQIRDKNDWGLGHQIGSRKFVDVFEAKKQAKTDKDHAKTPEATYFANPPR